MVTFVTAAGLYTPKRRAQPVVSTSARVLPHPRFGIDASFSLLGVTLSAQKYIAAFGLKPSQTPDSTFPGGKTTHYGLYPQGIKFSG